MIDGIELFGQNVKFTYSKDEYRASLDHFLLNDVSRERLVSCEIIHDYLATSDHQAIRARLQPSLIDPIYSADEPIRELKFHRFPWKNILFNSNF